MNADVLRYAWRELVRNPRRTVASLAGVVLGTALLAGVLFFVDGSAATMTRRAIAPLPIDMQRVVAAPLGQQLELTEAVSAPGSAASGEVRTFTVRFVNRADVTQHEVTVKDAPPEGFDYVSGSTRRDGSPLTDVDGNPPMAHGPAQLGINLGAVPGGGTVELTYRARAGPSVAADQISLDATATSREHLDPVPANRPDSLGLREFADCAASVTGVASADALSYVDLPPGALSANGRTVDHPIRVFAFDQSYVQHHPSISIDAGTLDPDAALMSVEAARALGVGPGESARLRLPGAVDPVTLSVSGLVDLSGARELFWSRKTSTFEDFLYVPNSAVVSHDVFERSIVPAFLAARSDRRIDIKSFPVSEVDIGVVRSRLGTDPARALDQTLAIARRVEEIGPAEGDLIDNISNTLRVARDDARAGKQMFLVIGLPGVVIAAAIAGYAASVLSASHRRERAVLRVHGAHRGHLRRLLAYRTALFCVTGAVFGVFLGLVSALAVLGRHDVFAASPDALALSASIAIASGTVVTSAALYVPGRRSLRRDVVDEQRHLQFASKPAWRRWWLDVAATVVGVGAGLLVLALGAFDTQSTNVSIGQSAVVPSYFLLPALVGWIGGAAVTVRIVDALTGRLPVPPPGHYGPVLRGTLLRSIRRRGSDLAVGAGAVSLIVALGVNLVIFADSYDDASAADARFAIGADLRLTPNVAVSAPVRFDASGALRAAGVVEVSPVIAEPANAVLLGPFDQNLQDLAAVAPATLVHVASLPAQVFSGGLTGTGAMTALETDPQALLVRTGTAEDLSIDTGDDVEVLLARGTDHQVTAAFHVVGQFDRFPGFPDGIDLIVDIATYESATGLRGADFFLVDVADTSSSGIDRAVAAIQGAPPTAGDFGVQTVRTALLKDQSSLTALNVRGLATLDRVYTLLLSAAVIGIFVFVLVLQRRTEFATLNARGMQTGQLGGLVLGESLVVAATGAMAGMLLGVVTSRLFVGVLHPLFTLTPHVHLDLGGLAVIGVLPLIAAAVASTVGTLILRRGTTELLRES